MYMHTNEHTSRGREPAPRFRVRGGNPLFPPIIASSKPRPCQRVRPCQIRPSAVPSSASCSAVCHGVYRSRRAPPSSLLLFFLGLRACGVLSPEYNRTRQRRHSRRSHNGTTSSVLDLSTRHVAFPRPPSFFRPQLARKEAMIEELKKMPIAIQQGEVTLGVDGRQMFVFPRRK